jgi:hypothetical protein
MTQRRMLDGDANRLANSACVLCGYPLIGRRGLLASAGRNLSKVLLFGAIISGNQHQ